MSVPVRLTDLRDSIAESYAAPTLSRDEALALVDAVEAALTYDGPSDHSYRCEYRTAEKGWKRGDPPVIECVCGLDRLNAALARFDLGGADGQPTTTKSQQRCDATTEMPTYDTGYEPIHVTTVACDLPAGHDGDHTGHAIATSTYTWQTEGGPATESDEP